MSLRIACLAAMAVASTLGVVAANEAFDEEPVLRLRFQDSTPMPSTPVQLRPRFPAALAQSSDPVPMPLVSVCDAGRVGKVAYGATPHPNVVVAVGATDDATELGRQIDRAIIDMTRSDALFSHQSDSTPFIGMGVRSGSAERGWSAEASMGMGMVNAPEASRLTAAYSNPALAEFETDARAHFRLRYKF